MQAEGTESEILRPVPMDSMKFCDKAGNELEVTNLATEQGTLGEILVVTLKTTPPYWRAAE